MKKLNVLISGGGTGGHIFPAIAIAEALKKIAETEVLFVGANGRMEMEKIPACGYRIVGLPIAGFQRRQTFSNMLKNIQLPLKIICSLILVLRIIIKFKPDVVIGTGGYASAPTLKMAQWMGIPSFIQEQNVLPGKTNLYLGNNVKCAFISYEESRPYFKNCEVVYTGNAIRDSFSDVAVDKNMALEYFNLSPNKKTIFVTGGSLGARAINEGIAEHFNDLINGDIQVLWQTGKSQYEKYKHFENANCRVFDFISNMNFVFAAADLVVTRAGGILFELFVMGKPVIVLPSPYVANDHQTPNALALVERNAAIMIRDNESKEKLVYTILELLNNEDHLQTMSVAMKKLARPKAAEEIAKKILETIS